ncbi:hypothetical protein [Porphyromonas sp.]|uniref:hypothetical protein n=1 Tax=Porphyromonas sp. TaxID=1924944 RepID=UPI0026DAC12D|nr:hypothetical protein [Porphyromonas sp.]MDO4771769.1 hypothetical protein [Porphyromonas sp.]
MCDEEARAVDGGVAPLVILAGKGLLWLGGLIAGGVVSDWISNPENTKKQFNEGYNEVRER